jgi:site-specific DNA recombinase
MKKRAVIYIRESTKFQDPESQKRECINYCKKNKLDIVKIYQDIASGANNNRKDFLQLLQDMEEDFFDVVVLWELSRSTRDFLMYKTTLMRMKELGKELYSLQEGTLTEDDLDKEFSTDIVALVNSHERKRVGRRVKIRREFATREGKWMGGKLPLGYKCVDGKIEIDPDTAPLVKEIFRLFLSGEKRTDIAKKFGFQDPKKINRLLVNPIYTGKLKLNETEMINDKRVYHGKYELIQGKHEAIIDDDTFKLSLILSKEKRREKYKNGDYLLKNVYCYDGDKMYPSTSKNRNKKPYYAAKFSGKVIGVKYLEETVINTLINEVDKLEILNTVESNVELEERKELYEKEIKKLKLQEERIFKKYIEGKLEEETFDKYDSDVKLKIKSFKSKIAEVEKLQLNKLKYEDNKKILREYIEKLSKTQEREELKQLLDIIIAEVRLINDFRVMVITNIF